VEKAGRFCSVALIGFFTFLGFISVASKEHQKITALRYLHERYLQNACVKEQECRISDGTSGRHICGCGTDVGVAHIWVWHRCGCDIDVGVAWVKPLMTQVSNTAV